MTKWNLLLATCLFNSASAEAVFDVTVTPQTIPINQISKVTYNLTNRNNFTIPEGYLTLPENFIFATGKKTSPISYTLDSSSTCAIKVENRKDMRPGDSCSIVFNINPAQLGSVQFKEIYGTTKVTPPQPLPFTSTTTVKVVPSKLYFFGDSYTDTGCYLKNNEAVYDRWPVFLGQDLSLPKVLPSSAKGGTNYACGGANAGHQHAPDKNMDIGVWDQIARFGIDNKDKADPNAGYFILIGGNDLSANNGLPYYPFEIRATPVINNIIKDVAQLQKLGAKNIYVLNQINQFGRQSSQGAQWGIFLDYFNNALNAAIANLNKQANSSVIVFDLSSNFYTMLNKPEHYGFANALSTCDSFPAYCTSEMRLASAVVPFLNVAPGSYVDAPLIAWFFANIHPTSAGHKFMEVMLRNFIYPPVYN